MHMKEWTPIQKQIIIPTQGSGQILSSIILIVAFHRLMSTDRAPGQAVLPFPPLPRHRGSVRSATDAEMSTQRLSTPTR